MIVRESKQTQTERNMKSEALIILFIPFVSFHLLLGEGLRRGLEMKQERKMPFHIVTVFGHVLLFPDPPFFCYQEN